MLKTAGLAASITSMNKNKTKINDYLPASVEAALLAKREAIKNDIVGAHDMDIVDTKGARICSKNKGFKMLQKMGWSEGKGLGTQETGVIEPIKAVNKTVIGVQETHEPSRNDDHFAAFRKRNMLAYRFRPNPYNNPRRGYDGYSTIYDNSNINHVIQQINDSTPNSNLPCMDVLTHTHNYHK
eukprot:GHVR01083327.1.p1 GENE.GHVR01083327.1~~GHVR01083327.1.p1  ORF type:complete len:183 (-),score=51.82 GHVR01083327.1:337-885(-)